MANMEVTLVGLHKVQAKGRTYYYAWRGGPRMKAKYGTIAFTQEFARLTKQRPEVSKGETVGKLIDAYVESADYRKLAPSTKRDYDRIISILRVKYATMPKIAVEAKGSVNVFLKWRDTMSETPRAADLNITVLARIFSWSKKRELLTRNPLEKVEKLHSGSRKDIIWMPRQLNTYLTGGAEHLVWVVKFALWTMQRQSDILTMTTLAYDDGRLWITQGKTGARVRIRAPEELIPKLEEAKAKKRQRILVNSFGDNWTSDGFRASFRKDMAELKISGVTFHDLRGTGITYAYANGADIEQIANISGHSKAECEAIIRKNYLANGEVIEAIRAGTKSE